MAERKVVGLYDCHVVDKYISIILHIIEAYTEELSAVPPDEFSAYSIPIGRHLHSSYGLAHELCLTRTALNIMRFINDPRSKRGKSP